MNAAGLANPGSLGQGDVQRVVTAFVTNKSLFPNGPDGSGMYILLTSPEVNVVEPAVEFCSVACGWHAMVPVAGVQVKFGFVGEASRQVGSWLIAPMCECACVDARFQLPKKDMNAHELRRT